MDVQDPHSAQEGLAERFDQSGLVDIPDSELLASPFEKCFFKKCSHSANPSAVGFLSCAALNRI
jgi:hypothetical protein